MDHMRTSVCVRRAGCHLLCDMLSRPLQSSAIFPSNGFSYTFRNTVTRKKGSEVYRCNDDEGIFLHRFLVLTVF